MGVPGPSRRLEVGLVLVFGIAWVWSALVEFGLRPPPPGTLGPYELFGLAAVLGWSAGNLWCWRQRLGRARRRLFFFLFIGPPGVLVLLARTVPIEPGQTGDFLGVLATGVFMVFFLVPVTFARAAERQR